MLESGSGSTRTCSRYGNRMQPSPDFALSAVWWESKSLSIKAKIASLEANAFLRLPSPYHPVRMGLRALSGHFSPEGGRQKQAERSSFFPCSQREEE